MGRRELSKPARSQPCLDRPRCTYVVVVGDDVPTGYPFVIHAVMDTIDRVTILFFSHPSFREVDKCFALGWTNPACCAGGQGTMACGGCTVLSK